MRTGLVGVQEERQRRARPVWICNSGEMQGGEEGGPRADADEDDEELEMNGGAETMGLEASHDDERAVEYMQQEGLTEEIRDGKQGNCCFRSLAAEAGWGSEKHQEMREDAVKVMRRDKMATDEECNRMSKAGTRGDLKAIEAASNMLGRKIIVEVMEPREGEPTVQRIGKTTNGMEGDRKMTVVYRREHFDSRGGEEHRREELRGRMFWMDMIEEHWKIGRWARVPEEAEGVIKAARRKAAELTGGVKHHACGAACGRTRRSGRRRIEKCVLGMAIG